MCSHSVFIAGLPAPQGSKKYVGGGRVIEMSRGLHVWRDTVAWVCRTRLPPYSPPYHVTLVFVMPRPKNPTYRWPVRGDLDKLVRAVCDGLQQSGVISDDKHIIRMEASKRYAQSGENTGVYLSLRTVKGNKNDGQENNGQENSCRL